MKNHIYSKNKCQPVFESVKRLLQYIEPRIDILILSLLNKYSWKLIERFKTLYFVLLSN